MRVRTRGTTTSKKKVIIRNPKLLAQYIDNGKVQNAVRQYLEVDIRSLQEHEHVEVPKLYKMQVNDEAIVYGYRLLDAALKIRIAVHDYFQSPRSLNNDLELVDPTMTFYEEILRPFNIHRKMFHCLIAYGEAFWTDHKKQFSQQPRLQNKMKLAWYEAEKQRLANDIKQGMMAGKSIHDIQLMIQSICHTHQELRKHCDTLFCQYDLVHDFLVENGRLAIEGTFPSSYMSIIDVEKLHPSVKDYFILANDECVKMTTLIFAVQSHTISVHVLNAAVAQLQCVFSRDFCEKLRQTTFFATELFSEFPDPRGSVTRDEPMVMHVAVADLTPVEMLRAPGELGLFGEWTAQDAASSRQILEEGVPSPSDGSLVSVDDRSLFSFGSSRPASAMR